MCAHRIVAFVGTGFLGRRVVWRLRQDGLAVVAVARSTRAQDGSDTHGARGTDFTPFDIRDRVSVARALRGSTAVVNCVGLYVETPTDTFDAVHVKGAHIVAEQARIEGVSRFVHVSGIGTDPASRSGYVRARAEGEEAVRRAFPGATILRPSVMFSGDRTFFGGLDAMVRRLPVIPLFGTGDTHLQPVYVRDVAEAVRRAIEDVGAVGRINGLHLAQQSRTLAA